MDSIWTIKKVLNRAVDCFKKKNILSYKIDSEILISYVLNTERLRLFMDFDRPLTKDELNKINKIIRRRTKYEPVAYIVGYKDFFSLSYLVNKNVLIPRPETELLVEEILNYDLKGKTVLDIGTGCGNIGTTIKKFASGSNITCCDISPEALKIARQNSQLLLEHDHIKFVQSDIYSDIFKTYDFIVSNPPYILTKEINHLQNDIKDFEPVIALDGGEGGMLFYKKIIPDIKKYLNPEGYLFLEINPVLKEKIFQLLKNVNLSPVKAKKDYSGLDRIIVAKNEN